MTIAREETATLPASPVDFSKCGNLEFSSTGAVLRPSKKFNSANGSLSSGSLINVIDKPGGTGTVVLAKNQANGKKYEKTRRLPEKEFICRPSLMTQMLALDEYQGLYNIFVATLLNLTAYMVISDLYEYGSIDLGISHIFSMFGKPLTMVPLLIGMHFCSAVPFYWTFRVWADHRHSFYSMESVWDLCFSIALGLFIYGFYYIPFQINVLDRLPPASAAIIVLEQLRLTMKLYAFIRSNVPRALRVSEGMMREIFNSSKMDNQNGVADLLPSKSLLNGVKKLQKIKEEEIGENGFCLIQNCNEENKENLNSMDDENVERNNNNNNSISNNNNRDVQTINNDQNNNNNNGEETPCPDYDKFVYFMYAPTLIYRDSYPRTSEIRWKFILTNAVELFGCIYLYNLIHHMCGFVLLRNFGLPGQTITLIQLCKAVFFQMIPGGLGFLLGFFVLLHTSQNIAAELLQFGDRMFYLDWYNADSFASYYRKWNLPVHDFLYTYIYKEAKEMRLDKVSKAFPAILVFALSSFFHEYVFIFVLQIFYPVIFIFFGGFGMILAFVPNKSSRSMGNLFIWWSLITGMGLIHSLYCLEYFARQNGCPPAESPALDFVLPRTFTCGAITL